MRVTKKLIQTFLPGTWVRRDSKPAPGAGVFL